MRLILRKLQVAAATHESRQICILISFISTFHFGGDMCLHMYKSTVRDSACKMTNHADQPSIEVYIACPGDNNCYRGQKGSCRMECKCGDQ